MQCSPGRKAKTHDHSSRTLLTEFPKQEVIESLSVFDIKVADGCNIFLDSFSCGSEINFAKRLTFGQKQLTPWPESASELYRPSGRSLSAKLVPTFADRGVSRSQRKGSPRPYSRFSRPEAATISSK
jgi:hypothetical protein